MSTSKEMREYHELLTLKADLLKVVKYKCLVIYYYVTIWNMYQILELPETNIAPVRRPSQKETYLPTPVFQVLLLLVSGRVYLPGFDRHIGFPYKIEALKPETTNQISGLFGQR